MKKLLVVALFLASAMLPLPGLHLPSVPRVEAALPPPSGALSPAPLNSNFSAGESVVSAPPNYGFELGLTSWTVDGDANAVSTPTGGQIGNYLRIAGDPGHGTPKVYSSPFVVDASGQQFTFYVNSFGSGGTISSVEVSTQAGGYTNWTGVGGCFYCPSTNGWVKETADLSGFVGQSVEIQYRAYGTLGFDEGAWRTQTANWTTGGGPSWIANVSAPATTASLGDYSLGEAVCTGAGTGATNGQAVELHNNDSITSAPFTLPGDSPRLPFLISGSATAPSASITLYLASEGYANTHVVFNKSFAAGQSFFTSCLMNQWAGQTVKIRIQGSYPGLLDVFNGGGLSFYAGGSGTVASSKNPDMRGDPVSLVTGAMTHTHTDIQVPGKGVPLEFTRTYSTGGLPMQGRLGHGWTDNYNSLLSIFNDGSVSVRYPDGSGAFFTYNAGIFTAPRGVNDALVKNGDNTYTLTTTAQLKYNYSTTGKLTSIKDRNNNTTTLAYDGSGNISSVTDPGGRQLTFTVDGSGRITLITAPMSRTIGFGYDANGDLATVTDVKGGTTTYTYSNHRLATLTDSLNHLQTTTTYDNADRVVEQRDAVNGTTCFYYGHGPTYTSANCPGVSPAAQPGQTIMVDPRGNKQIHQFDTSFRPTGIEDALGNDTLFTYEATGALCSPANNGNLCSVTDPIGHVTSYAYDAKGNTLTRTDAASKTWTYTYNSFDDVLTETDPLTRVTTYTYDPSGNLLTAKNALNQITMFTPNADGTLASVKDPLNHTTSFGYNANGLRTSVTDALTHATNYTYDAGGRQLTKQDALTHATTYTYDNQNNVLTVTDALTHVTTNVYNAKGLRTSTTDANNKTTTFGYDNADRLTTVTDPLTQTVTYGYDANSNRTSMTNTRSKITTYVYDAANRLASTTDPNNKTTTYTYDAASRLATRLDAKSQTTTYGYDVVNRLTSVTYPAGTPNVSYTYDALGNRLTMVDGTGTTTTVPDALYRPSTVTDGAGNVVGYGYDAAGRRTTITYPAGTGTATYNYDNADRLTSVVDWNNKTTTYTYDTANRLATTATPDGVTETRTYDNADRLATILTKKGSTTIVSYTYTVDSVGNRTKVVDTNGTTTPGYDSLYRVNAMTYPNGDTQSYTYDPMGNRLTKVNNGSTTNYTSDDADQMTAAGGVTYGYDNNGNQTSRGTDTFGYDAENRLTSTTLGGTSGSYVYNGDGLRTSRTIGGVTTAFTWGNAAEVPAILRDSAGNRYLYGLDLISLSNSANSKFYYHTDGLGSTTAITNSSGSVVKTYQYDVFGAIRAQTGTQPNEFTFTGEQVDGSGLQYLRARFYDNATGRFLGRDPLPGASTESQSLNRYPYVLNDPVNLTDPLGLHCRPWHPHHCVEEGAQAIAENVVEPAASRVIECVGGPGACASDTWQASLQVAAIIPYGFYYGCYKMNHAVHSFVLLGCQVAGLAGDIGIDYLQGLTGRHVSICDEGKEGGVVPIYGGPKTHLPGLHKDCKAVDIEF
jgi:RHS repeat-associated protein